MAKFFRVLSVLASLAYFCTPTAAQAIPITIDFSGTLTQATAGGCAYCGTYTATIFFDTADGLFQQTGPNSYYFAPPDVFGHLFAQFSNGISIYADGGGDYVAWSPGLLTGNIGGAFSHLALPSDGIRYIQVGTCGSFCSFISVDQFSVGLHRARSAKPRHDRRGRKNRTPGAMELNCVRAIRFADLTVARIFGDAAGGATHH